MMTDFFTYQAEMQQEGTLCAVCTRLAKVIDKGKSLPTPFQTLVAEVGADLSI